MKILLLAFGKPLLGIATALFALTPKAQIISQKEIRVAPAAEARPLERRVEPLPPGKEARKKVPKTPRGENPSPDRRP